MFPPIGDKIHRNILVSCDHGLMIVNRFDCNHEQVGHGQWLLDHGNCSTVEASSCVQVLKNINLPIIFDVGANIGTFTTWMAKAFPSSKIYCFEPQHAVFQQLAGNIALNNLYNVYTYNIALGSFIEYVELYQPDYFQNFDFGTFSIVKQDNIPRTTEKNVIQVLTVDKFMEIYKVPRLDLLKIDAEGMDLQVLLGASYAIKSFRPKIFVEHFDNITSLKNDIELFLKPFGYKFDSIGNNLLAY